MEHNTLTDQEKLFCELYIDGSASYAGNAIKCYKEVFQSDSQLNGHQAKLLIARPEVQQYLEELQDLSYEEAKHMKNFLTSNLKGIIEECATAKYLGKTGRELSPAPLRSVAVAGAKALMEMYPVKDAHQNKSNEGGESAGITFNVIIPGAQTNDSSKEQNPD